MKYFSNYYLFENDKKDKLFFNAIHNAIKNNNIDLLLGILKQGYEIPLFQQIRLSDTAMSNKVNNYDILKYVDPDKYTENIERKNDHLTLHGTTNATKLTGITSLINLKDLTYHGGFNSAADKIEDISEIEHNINLEKIGFTDHNIKDISVLSKLKKLKEIFLPGNENLVDFTPLQDLPNLEYLFIGRCNIKDLSFLSSMTSLKHLNIEKSNVEDLSPLSNLINLERLDISNNNVKDITLILNLPLLQLNLSGNEITSLKGIETMMEIPKHKGGVKFRDNPLPEEILQYVNPDPKWDNVDDIDSVKKYYRNN